jgi:hypothetical protein
VAGQYEGDGCFLRNLLQFLFEPGQIGRPEAMERGDGARLKKIRHTLFL